MSKASISAHSFPSLSESCSLLGTDNVCNVCNVDNDNSVRVKYPCIFSHKIEAIVFIIVQHM